MTFTRTHGFTKKKHLLEPKYRWLTYQKVRRQGFLVASDGPSPTQTKWSDRKLELSCLKAVSFTASC